ncbi:MAG: sulfotransferase domain-containing protein [Gemmataceae bacterium]|nr:sulfotransferase domain-containing protein [Gemmataceae bacterium]
MKSLLKACLPHSWRAALRRVFPWRVGFLVGGTMKGGTTALASFLAKHPALALPGCKEAHHFDEDSRFPKGGRPDHSPYFRHFDIKPATRLLGDATPSYLFVPQCAPRAMAYNPAMKWVLLLRQPAERAYSHWNMQHRDKQEPLSFEEALEAEPGLLARLGPNAGKFHAYAERGFYARQLRRLFAVVPRRQVLVLRSEELRDAHEETLRRVFRFLGVDERVEVAAATVFAHAYEKPMDAGLRARLTARFAEDMDDLERLLGWDLRAWR